MTACYIFDIDGTIADCSHRRHHVEGSPKNWPAFNAGCVDDEPIDHICELFCTLREAGVPCVFVTGRSEEMREDTIAWLNGQGLWEDEVVGLHDNDDFESVLYMRPSGDYRDDAIVKLELLQRLRDDGYDPIMAFDDRDRVVKMWRDNGVPCAQVAPGDF